MNYSELPSYYFDFGFEADTNENDSIDLEWISKTMGFQPSCTRRAKFTQWSKYSRVYRDWDMDKNLEKFVEKFYKRQKQILQILQIYPILSVSICYVPTFYDDVLHICQITPKIAKQLSEIQACFNSDPQIIFSKSRIKEFADEFDLNFDNLQSQRKL